MKKSTVLTLAGLSVGVGLLSVSGTAKADVWRAKTPDQIGALRSADGTYTVQEGDTIWAIGVHFNVKPAVIEKVNDITNPYDLQIGTVLKIKVDEAGNTGTLQVIKPNGDTKTYALSPKDKIDQSKKFGESAAAVKTSQTTYQQAPSEVTAQQGNNGNYTVHTTPSNQANNTQREQPSISPSMGYEDPKGFIKTPSQDDVAMLGYYAAYREGGWSTISPEGLTFVDEGNGHYAISPGTNGSEVVVNGNQVTVRSEEAWNETTTTYFNVPDLVKKYYHTPDQRAYINRLVQTAEDNAASQNQK